MPKLQQGYCYVSAGGNSGPQSLLTGIKAALLLDNHSLSISQLLGLLIIFKMLQKQDWTEDHRTFFTL
jgi:hypothetical protein